MEIRKAYKGLPMEGVIATWYAKNTGRDRRRFQEAVRAISGHLRPGSRVLEIAPGPGYLAVELAKAGYSVTGLDISRSFVDIARQNAVKAGVVIDFRVGNASAMPFAAESFDFLVCMAAFKNFTDPLGAINEMYRVLEPGCEAWIYDLRKDASPEEIGAEVRGMNLSRWNAALTRWIFRHGLLRAAYTREQLRQFAAQSDFGSAGVTSEGIGLKVILKK